jgi:hypothetical protein
MDFDQEIRELERQVKAAEEEVSTAVTLHESWKPTVHDTSLLERMGESYATQTFIVIRWALRREVLLALLRVWDDNNKAVSLGRMIRTLRNGDFFNVFVSRRVTGSDFAPRQFLEDHLRSTCGERIIKAGELIDKYAKNGAASDVMTKLLTLRNVSLAHRQQAPQKAGGGDATDNEIESFYQDTLRITEHLMHVVRATALDFEEAAQVYGTYARYFWAAARGERNTGHPSYWEPPER